MNDISKYKSESPLAKFSKTILSRFIAPGLVPVRQANTIILLLIEFMTENVDAEFLKYAVCFIFVGWPTTKLN